MSSASYAQAYPHAPITIIVPYPAGGGVDTMARLFGAALQAKWGHPVVVENRAGGNGAVGAQLVAKASPDGYTLLASAEGPLVMNQHLYTKLNYDPTAFTPVTIISSSPMFLSVTPSVPVGNLAELLAYAKAHPGALRYGTSGVGAPSHLSGVMLEMKTGIELTQVPYKGSAQSLSDFLGDHINMLFAFQTSAGPYFNTDKMKVLAVTSPQRHPAFPAIPAIAETLPGFAALSWVAMVAPPGTPPEIASKLSSAIAEAMKSPEIKKKIEELGSTPIANTPAEAGAFLKEESGRWGEVIRAAKLKVD
ncbi:tripartite tricarboxylate transporter substrate binding protein [Pigmentiphaga soli]|uniref:Tripartite tricarboxylate transporter substrate binding protein n=1 Tax=Pigmentiphaga soli TaxID=1007095 RepID=A0ABP8GK32_9BURK